MSVTFSRLKDPVDRCCCCLGNRIFDSEKSETHDNNIELVILERV
jgi:hypothetical protein